MAPVASYQVEHPAVESGFRAGYPDVHKKSDRPPAERHRRQVEVVDRAERPEHGTDPPIPHDQAHQGGNPDVRVLEEMVESLMEGVDGWPD